MPLDLPPEGTDNWMRWGIGLSVALLGGLFNNLYSRIAQVKDEGEVRMQSALREIKGCLEQQRAEAAVHRERIAAENITRAEFNAALDLHFNRLTDLLDRSIRKEERK